MPKRKNEVLEAQQAFVVARDDDLGRFLADCLKKYVQHHLNQSFLRRNRPTPVLIYQCVANRCAQTGDPYAL